MTVTTNKQVIFLAFAFATTTRLGCAVVWNDGFDGRAGGLVRGRVAAKKVMFERSDLLERGFVFGSNLLEGSVSLLAGYLS